MKKHPIAIDLSIIIDPYKMLSIIQGIDKIYSEIVIPLPLSFIEIWHPQWRSYTFKLFQDTTILEANLEEFFGFTDGITVNNFVAGMKLLIMAYQKGMVRVVDSTNYFSYEKIGKELLGVDLNFNNIKQIELPGNKVLYINPDSPILETLYGMQSDGIIPIYGDSDFINYWHTSTNSYNIELNLQKTPYHVTTSSRLQTLLYENKITDLSEAFSYVSTNNPFEKLDIELRNTIEDYEKKKDLFLLSLEFISTTTIDTIVGVPLSSGALFAYEFAKKLISKDNN